MWLSIGSCLLPSHICSLFGFPIKETKKPISTKEADKILKEHHESHEHFIEEETKKTKKTSKSAKKKKTNRKK